MSEDPILRRALGLSALTFYGLGTILGAGIYVLVGKVAGYAGMYAPLAFLVAGLVAAFTAFSYAELATRYPNSAGEAIYVQEGLHLRALSIVVGSLIVASGVVSCASLVKGFVGYLDVFVHLPHWLVIAGIVVALGALASWGIRESVQAASFITVIEITGLLLVIAVSAPDLATLPAHLPQLLPPPEAGVWNGILLGAFVAFYAFLGFEDMVNVVEEVTDPQHTMPRAIFLAVGIATLLYLLVAVAAVLSMPQDQLARSSAPLAEMYVRATGQAPLLISAISLFAVLNGALIQIVMGSRVLYGMSHQGWLPHRLGRVSPSTQTPLSATVAMTLAVLVFALSFPLLTLAKATSFFILIVFALVNLSLLRVKRCIPAVTGVRSYPAWVPTLGFLFSLGLIGFQIAAWLVG